MLSCTYADDCGHQLHRLGGYDHWEVTVELYGLRTLGLVMEEIDKGAVRHLHVCMHACGLSILPARIYTCTHTSMHAHMPCAHAMRTCHACVLVTSGWDGRGWPSAASSTVPGCSQAKKRAPRSVRTGTVTRANEPAVPCAPVPTCSRCNASVHCLSHLRVGEGEGVRGEGGG